MTVAATPAVATADVSARDRILDAAVELFAEQGYDAVSVAQIVDRVGLTKGGFYHHFASKEQLLYEVYGDLISRQLATMDDIVARRLAPPETLRLLIVDLVQSTAASAQRALVFGREMSRLGNERTSEYRRARRRYHDTVQKLVRSGQRSGVFARTASADVVTFTIFGMVNELPLWFRSDGRKKSSQLGTELADFVLAGLGVPGA